MFLLITVKTTTAQTIEILFSEYDHVLTYKTAAQINDFDAFLFCDIITPLNVKTTVYGEFTGRYRVGFIYPSLMIESGNNFQAVLYGLSVGRNLKQLHFYYRPNGYQVTVNFAHSFNRIVLDGFHDYSNETGHIGQYQIRYNIGQIISLGVEAQFFPTLNRGNRVSLLARKTF